MFFVLVVIVATCSIQIMIFFSVSTDISELTHVFCRAMTFSTLSHAKKIETKPATRLSG